MDPDANLKEQVELAEKLAEIALGEEGTFVVDGNDVTRLCELVLSLDTWIKSGGALPQTWRRKTAWQEIREREEKSRRGR